MLLRTGSASKIQKLRLFKMPFQQGRSESKPEAYPQGYVEDFDEGRTQLEGHFQQTSTILPKNFLLSICS